MDAELKILDGLRFHCDKGAQGTLERLRRYSKEGDNRRNLLGQTMEEAANIIERLLNHRHSGGDGEDAARYRWLRRKVSAHGVIDGWTFAFPTHLTLPAPPAAMRDPASALDAAIDAARAGERGSTCES